MRAQDLEIGELVGSSDGNLSLQGRRLVLHSIHAFARFRRDLVETLGMEQTRRLFTRFGYFWGHADAAAMRRVFQWPDQTELLRAGFRLQSIEGIARARVSVLDVDSGSGRIHIECDWHESGEAEEHVSEIGATRVPTCWKLVGYASGYVSHVLDRPVYFLERRCRACGDSFCHAEGRDLDSWGDEIKPHLKYFEADDIIGTVRRLSHELKKKDRQLTRSRGQFGSADNHRDTPFFVEGRSKALRQVIDLAERVAQFDSSVLITGETGVGKEVLARHIHGVSHRAKRPFVAVNCGALPESLLESELFGYKAGAFTGAVRDRTGLFEQAAGGTMFLDEIGDITPAMQIKILRVLQEREIMRIGESVPRPVDVRIIAATNHDLDALVSEGRFRDDLLYRLRVIEIEIPPLRQRREDILPLARFLVEKLSGKLRLENLRLDATCLDYLQAYSWPGNVRELENALERAAVLSRDNVILPEALPPLIVAQVEAGAGEGDPLSRPLEDIVNSHILSVLYASGGNRARTARILGISTATLWRKLKALGTTGQLSISK
ncbi:MAG: sigma-54-dependent Fis family transcriptional regulator [candidate division Zixibacteria bacterium]|nr:sigma-54-dependent Fis family transcriptional regulator [candidate division Zixibacteria bacterium]